MTSYTWIDVAITGEEFRSFGPYVPAISPEGAVAFQANRTDGRSGVFVYEQGHLKTAFLAADAGLNEVVSHPDIHGSNLCFYACDARGKTGAFRYESGKLECLQSEGVGPLGPTMNASGEVAFRSTAKDGRGLIVSSRAGILASTGPFFTRFHGLPVIAPHGAVFFRADQINGGQGLYRAYEGRVEALLDSSDPSAVFQSLANFPSAADDETLAFAATEWNGETGVFILASGRLQRVLAPDSACVSFRGAMMGLDRNLVFIAYDAAGRMAIHANDPAKTRLLGQGEELHGSTIREFAMNPVSLKNTKDFVVRVLMDDGRELIRWARSSR